MSVDQFYVMAEDGITKLAGPFESEEAAVAEIEKVAEEVAAEAAAEKVEAPVAKAAHEAKTAELVPQLETALVKMLGPKDTWKSTTFGDRFWALVKDAVQLPSWGAVNGATSGGDTTKQSSAAADRSTDSVSSGSHIVIQVAPAAENQAAGLTAVDDAEVADGSDLVQKYAIAKSVEPQRYTLGVAYPANRVDVHGDFMDAADLEKAAWAFLSKADAGVMHQKGSGGAGQVVESYIHRGPTYKSEGGDEVRPGDWMLGVVWGQPTWDRINKGELKGFSFQGFAKRAKSVAPAK